jgi:hypothetical protein
LGVSSGFCAGFDPSAAIGGGGRELSEVPGIAGGVPELHEVPGIASCLHASQEAPGIASAGPRLCEVPRIASGGHELREVPGSGGRHDMPQFPGIASGGPEWGGVPGIASRDRELGGVPGIAGGGRGPRELPASGGRPRKKNAIPKGSGPDAAPDPAGRDHFEWKKSKFCMRLREQFTKHPAQSVCLVCRYLMCRWGGGLLKSNRYVTRRAQCAYAWLKENRKCGTISDEMVAEALQALRAEGTI